MHATSLSAIPPDVIFNGLPMELQVEVAAHTNKAVVDAAALLRGTSEPFAERLAAMLQLRHLDADTVLHRTAEACTELVFVAAGAVEVIRPPTAACLLHQCLCGSSPTGSALHCCWCAPGIRGPAARCRPCGSPHAHVWRISR